MMLLQNKKQYLFQLIRFGGVGVVNTTIDFLVLNLLNLIFGIDTSRHDFTFFKAISFSVAVVNSYFMNKYWVFRHRTRPTKREQGMFLLVSVIGLCINTVISTVLFRYFIAHNIHSLIAINGGALVGTLFVFIWNYAGYKRFVFKYHE